MQNRIKTFTNNEYKIVGRILLGNDVSSKIDIDLEMDPLRDWAKK